MIWRRLVVAPLLGLAIMGAVPSVGFSEPATVEERLDRLETWKEKITIGVNAFQIQYYRDEGDQLADGTPIGSGTSLGRNGLKLRRAELYLRGRITERVAYYITADANGSGTPIRDAYLDVAWTPSAGFRLGQFRIPFGIEPQTSSRKLLFIDRVLISSLGEQQRVIENVLQERDLGVRLAGEPLSGPLNVSYAAALVNGEGTNKTETNGLKDVVGRFGLRLAGVQIGASAYRGKRQDAAFVDRDRTRFGWDAEFNPNYLKALLIRAELITGRDDLTHRRGWYAVAAYQVTDHWQPAARFEAWDPDSDAAGDTFTRTTLGVNYYLAGDTKLAANYEFRNDKAHPGLGNLALAQYQISF